MQPTYRNKYSNRTICRGMGTTRAPLVTNQAHMSKVNSQATWRERRSSAQWTNYSTSNSVVRPTPKWTMNSHTSHRTWALAPNKSIIRHTVRCPCSIGTNNLRAPVKVCQQTFLVISDKIIVQVREATLFITRCPMAASPSINNDQWMLNNRRAATMNDQQRQPCRPPTTLSSEAMPLVQVTRWFPSRVQWVEGLSSRCTPTSSRTLGRHKSKSRRTAFYSPRIWWPIHVEMMISKTYPNCRISCPRQNWAAISICTKLVSRAETSSTSRSASQQLLCVSVSPRPLL